MKTVSIMMMIVMVVGFLSCTCQQERKKMSPQEVLTTYLEKVINITDESEKDDLIHHTTGQMKAVLMNIDSDTFRETYLKNKYEVFNFNITDSQKVSEDEMNISFYIHYSSKNESSDSKEDEVKSMVQNQVQMLREGGRWKIAQIHIGSSELEFIRGQTIQVQRSMLDANLPPPEDESADVNSPSTTNTNQQ